MSWRKYLAVLSPGIMVVAVAAALALATSVENAEAAQYTVNIRDFSFNPTSLTVQIGDVVRWENAGAASHTTSSPAGMWESGTLAPGGAFTQQFMTAGTFEYLCRIHPNMTGMIVVQSQPVTPTAAATGTPVPASATVPPTSAATPATPIPTAAATATPQPTVVVQPPQGAELWLLVQSPTPALTLNDTLAWIARPGEWYQVYRVDSGWALARWELDPPTSLVWIQIDARVDLSLY